MNNWITLLCASLISISSFSQLDIESNKELMDYLHGSDPVFNAILDSTDLHRVQFIYTRIDKENGDTTLKTFNFSNSDFYFYPASVVKLPTALITLEKMKEHDLSLDAYMKIHRDQTCGNMSYIEEMEDNRLTMGKMLKELIIVSNNRYYNALYQFVTPKDLNERMASKGISDTKIYRSFTGCEMPYNLFCNSLTVTDQEKRKTMIQESSRLDLSRFASRYIWSHKYLFGSKHEYRGNIVNGPFDFNYHLDYPLKDIHGTMLRLVKPNLFAEEERWDITESDRDYFLGAMKGVPSDLSDEKYKDKKDYPDNIFKYIVKGDENPDFKNVETYSKIGIAYGFVTETAYVVDKESDIEFFLTASIYVNANDTVNDGKYEYDEVGRPFLTQLGQKILDYERRKVQ
ncbi:MAG: serine hydrolase [Crocinitomicaceae bacterium]|nr:serine hydrolase [Crocinitomicaceae bacterium]MDG1657402.1 serine hydrolase [Crocinitomicaceae bacterium]